MKAAMVESSANSSASHSFLLDDDSTLPFSAGDIIGQMDDKVGGWGHGLGGGELRGFGGCSPLGRLGTGVMDRGHKTGEWGGGGG